MKAPSRTKQELLKENAFLRQKIRELEQSESERKNADAALHESEERFKQLFDNMADGVAVYRDVDDGQDFVFVEINRAGQFLSKIRHDEVVGRRVTEVFPSVERMGLLDVFRRVWRTGQPEHHPLTEYADNRIVQWVENYVCKLPSGLIGTIFYDSNEKLRAETLLRQSEENFRRSLNDSPLGVRIVTEEGETIYVNRAILNIYGYDSLEDFRTIPVKERYTPESYSDYLIRREKRKQGIDAQPEYEINIVRKDGEVRNLLVFCKKILWDGKKRFQVLYTNITERRQAEEALRASELWMKSIFKSVDEAIFVVTPDRTVVNINDAAESMFGYLKDELAELSTEVLHVDHEHYLVFGKLIKEAFDRGETANFEFKAKRKNGEVFQTEHTLSLLKDQAQNAIGIISVVRDITERKNAEKELRESEAFARSTLDGLSAHIAIIDEFGVIVVVNRSWREFADENPPVRGNVCEGANYLDICDGAPSEAPEAARFAEAIRSILHGSAEKFEMEYACHSPEEQRWFVGRVTRFPDSTVPRVVVAHENITDCKQAEEGLKTSQQQLRDLAERLQQIREEERVLIAREIHDVMGGGLTGLKMDISRLMHKVKKTESYKEHDELMSRFLSINENIDHMIKEARRISTGLRPPFIDDLGLISVIDWELSEFTGRTGILHELTTQFEHVNMEKEKAVDVFRIFQEMLINVIRHSGATKVVVVLRKDDERDLFGDENLVLEIRDNGRGITEEEILDKKSLGLLGMKERAMAFGGEFSIRGEPGGGTTVVLKIPRKKGETS